MKLIFILFVLIINTYGQQYSFSGFVQDSIDAEALSDVLIKINDDNWGAYSNNYGYFFVESKSKINTITFSYVGYKTRKISISPISKYNANYVVKLAPEILITQEILIEGESFTESGIGRSVIPISDIKQMPSVGGEADPVKAIQLFPGVLKSIEGGTSFHVRGGDFDQNLILLDGIPVYNISHFFGFLSVFNIDAIKQMEFIRAGFEPKYGGKLSSVLNLTMKEGNQNHFEYKGGISLLSSRILVEGPLASNSSMMFSARRTYLDPIIRLINSGITSGDKLADYYFYDINAKLKFGLSDLSKIYFSTYFGKDKLDYQVEDENTNQKRGLKLDWGNQTYLLRWNYLWSKRLFSNISVGYTKYQADIDIDTQKFPQSQRRPVIADYLFDFNFDYYFSDNLFINYGYHFKNHHIGISKSEAEFNFIENIFFASLEFKINNLMLNAGLRYNYFNETEVSSINPRIKLSYQINNRLKLTINYDRLTQPIHKLSFNNIFNPGDLFFPPSSKLKPQESVQYSAGLSYQIKHADYFFNFGFSAYYKEMDNLSIFIYNIDEIDKASILNNLSVGSGVARGVEFESNFISQGFQIMANYSYLNSWRKFHHKNGGKRFHPKFDRTHYFNFYAKYPFTNSLSFAATFNVSSGQIINYAVQKYGIFGIQPEVGNENVFFDYGQLNHIRADFNTRLDVSMTYKLSDHWELFLSIYNVLGNEYPIFYEYDKFTNKYSGTSLGLLPTFGFNFNY